jgi:hypothetical protein
MWEFENHSTRTSNGTSKTTPEVHKTLNQFANSSIMANNNAEQDPIIVADPLTNESNDAVASTELPTTTAAAMKLVVRSPYWGRVLKGKPRRNHNSPTKPYRVITCQAVLTNEGQYWGCCPHHGKRVLELKEHHFTDQHPHDWDLYMVGSSVTSAYVVHAFFLLPQNQTVIDINLMMSTQGWSYVGTVSASVARMDLEGMLQDVLKQNENYGFRYHHVHLEVLMDQIFDRETPRTRKAAIEQKRGVLNSTNYDGNHAPSIPRVVSNDMSWTSDTTHSGAGSVTNSMGPESLADSPVASCWTAPEACLSWYPASAMQVPHHQMMPVHPPVLMNPAQHMLHYGFPMAGNMAPPVPAGYAVPYGFHQGGAHFSDWRMMQQHPEFIEAVPFPDIHEGTHP